MPRLTKAQKLALANEKANNAKTAAASADAVIRNASTLAAAAPRVAPANNGNLQPLASNVSLAVIAEHGADETGVDLAALRNLASKLFHAIDDSANRRLVPIKPLAGFRAYSAKLGADKNQNPSDRNTAAIAVAAIASGKPIKAGSVIKRRFILADGAFGIENGATADIHFAGIANYDAETESFRITKIGEAEINKRHGATLAAITLADLI